MSKANTDGANEMAWTDAGGAYHYIAHKDIDKQICVYNNYKKSVYIIILV